MDGQPFFYVNKEVDPGLIATLKQDVIPWLEANVAPRPEPPQSEDAPWFTIVFDREGYSPAWFQQLWEKRIAVLTYHKYPDENWSDGEFAAHSVTLSGGETVTMKLAERETRLSNRLAVREIRKLTASGHQTSILTTNLRAPMPALAVSMFARMRFQVLRQWNQENFFRYMRSRYGLDRLVDYQTEPVPDSVLLVNPEWRKLDSQIRSKNGRRLRWLAQFGSFTISADPSESEVQQFEQRKGQLQEQIQLSGKEIETLKQQRKETPHHVTVKSLPEQDRFTRLSTERKHFTDTIRMIAYRAESSMASLLREHLARNDDARSLLSQVFQTEADLQPDPEANTLTVRLHHLTQAAHDEAIAKLCADLNATQTVFPGTSLRLIFKLGSS